MEIRDRAPDRDAEPLAVVMRTPGHDFELAVGFCVTEGIVDRAPTSPRCATASAPMRSRSTTSSPSRPAGRWTSTGAPRDFVSGASCGVCGKATLDQLEVSARRSAPGPTVPMATWSCAARPLRAAQTVFDATGGLHAAGARRADGVVDVVREDVGRHNAVDKLVGHAALADGCRSADAMLWWSRAGPASRSCRRRRGPGSPTLVAVSAPSSLAVATADRFGMTLVGFVRDGGANVYTGDHGSDLTLMAWPGRRGSSRPKGTRRDLWVGYSPNGIGQQKPNHYLDMAKIVWVNRRHLPYAWRILRKGVCDGCALGVAGFHDWTISGVHLCTTRLNLLRMNTMEALDPGGARRRRRHCGCSTVPRCATSAGCRIPMVRRAGERGFARVIVGRRARPGRGPDPCRGDA